MKNKSKNPLSIVISLILVVVLGILFYMNLRDNNTECAILTGITLLLNAVTLIAIFVQK